MNQAHFHLLVNHLPILGTLFGMLILFIGLIIKNVSIKRTGLGLLIFASLAVFPAHITGEGAEEEIENNRGIDKNYIHEHEEQADIFMGILIALGVVAIITLVADLLQKTYSPVAYIITLVLCCVTVFFALKTATTGGEINHPEIRDDVIALPLPNSDANNDE
jgi:uncharacterized membrane protein